MEKGALLKASHVLAVAAAVLLVGLTLIAGSSPDAPAKAGHVNEATVLADASHGTHWMVDGGDFGERHFSALKEINDKNVNNLGLAWSLDIDSPMGMASEPMVVDGRITLPIRSRACMRWTPCRGIGCGRSIRKYHSA